MTRGRPVEVGRSTRKAAAKRPARTVAAVMLGAVLTVTLTTFTAPMAVPPAIAQGAARLDLVAQTIFVGADPAVIDVRALGAPAGTEIRVRVHEAVTSRSDLESTIAGRPPTDVIGQWSVPDLDAARVGAGDVISLAVPDDEIGELLRRPSDTGPHPVVVELVDGETVLDTLVTHLLVPPGDERPAGPHMTVALLLDLRVPVSIRPDGAYLLDRAELERIGELSAALAARIELPVTVRLSPETFDALTVLGERAALDALRLAAVGHSVLLGPWVDMDEESWRRAGREDLVVAAYAAGRASFESADVGAGSVVALDPTAAPETVSLLAAAPIGARGFVVDPQSAIGVPDAVAAPVGVTAGDNTTHPAVVPDQFVADLLAGADPELAVQHALAEMLRMALAQTTSDAGVLVAPKGIDPLVLDLLLAGLDQPGPLVPGTVEEVLALPPAEVADGIPVVARLQPPEPDDLSGHVARRAEIEHRLEAYTSLIRGNDQLTEPLRTTLAASVATGVADSRDDYLSFVAAQVDAGLSGIELVESGRITITSRRAELPIVVSNDRGLAIRVVLALSAEKIDFPGGDRQTVSLQPGENAIPLEVVALASGDSAINITVETPHGGIELDSEVVRLRSTAISGLGLLISVIALAVLVGWWIRDFRRRRRMRKDTADSVPAAVAVAEPDPDDARTDGGPQ